MFPIQENTPFILFRRGKTEHIKSLFEKGQIYINTVDTIRHYDDNQERSDPNDCISHRKFIGDVKVEMCDVGLDINKHGTPFNGKDFTFNIDGKNKGNIYSLSGIYTKDLIDKEEISEFKTQTFGESLIVIINPSKFIQRVIDGLQKAGYKNIEYAPVEYYSNDYSGHIGLFKKHQKFSSQNEFRFYVPNPNNDPIKINIGSIEDIAVMKESCSLKFELTDKRVKIFKLI